MSAVRPYTVNCKGCFPSCSHRSVACSAETNPFRVRIPADLRCDRLETLYTAGECINFSFPVCLSDFCCLSGSAFAAHAFSLYDTPKYPAGLHAFRLRESGCAAWRRTVSCQSGPPYQFRQVQSVFVERRAAAGGADSDVRNTGGRFIDESRRPCTACWPRTWSWRRTGWR